MSTYKDDSPKFKSTGAAWGNPFQRLKLDPKEPVQGDPKKPNEPDLDAQLDARITAHLAPISKALEDQNALISSLKGLIPAPIEKPVEKPAKKGDKEIDPELLELRANQTKLADELTKERTTRRDAEKRRIIAEGFRGVNFMGEPQAKSVLRETAELIQYDEKQDGFFAEVETPIAQGSKTMVKTKVPADAFIKSTLKGDTWNWAIVAEQTNAAGAKGGKANLTTLPATYAEALENPSVMVALAEQNPEHLNRLRLDHKRAYGFKAATKN